MTAKININHNLRLIPQSNRDNCWIAVIAMLKGAMTYTPQPYVETGFFLSVHGGIPPQADYIKRLARAYRLRYAELKPSMGASKTLPQLLKLLTVAPVGVFDTQALHGKTVPHATAIGAMNGESTPLYAMLTEYDPWPPNQGRTRRFVYATWIAQKRYVSNPQTVLCLLY